ncbi:hypothetical protein [Schlesneria sp.]|uniref:hypothetical protein n=1 Tax=Schlesneria sp. TaxID=2762018 RepID=UPI002EE6CBB9
MQISALWNRPLSQFHFRSRVTLAGALVLLASFVGWQYHMDIQHQFLADTLRELGCIAEFQREDEKHAVRQPYECFATPL